MSFKFEDLTEELFSRVIAFSYSIGSGLGDPGAIIMLTNDGKEYFVGEAGFEGNWIQPEKTFHFMENAFNSNNTEWIQISKNYAYERIYFRKELKNGSDSLIKEYYEDNEFCDVSFKWVSLVWQILGIDPDNIEHIVYDKTREIAEKEVANRKRSEEHFKKVLLKPDSFEWRKLYYDNYIPKDDNLDGCWLLQGYYLLLFKKVDTCRVDGHMMTIAFQREQSREGEHTIDAKVEAYNLFYHRFEDVRGPLEIPECKYESPIKNLENAFAGYLTCYCVNTRDEFIRSYSSLEEAKKGAMYWFNVRGGIDCETAIPYGTKRGDEAEIRKREIREAELYLMFIERYADVIEVLKKYDYPGNATDEVAKLLRIDENEVGFIYKMFKPVLFSTTRLATIKKLVGEGL